METQELVNVNSTFKKAVVRRFLVAGAVTVGVFAAVALYNKVRSNDETLDVEVAD